MRIAGHNFMHQPVVLVNGRPHGMTYVSRREIKICLTAHPLVKHGNIEISLENPGLGGGAAVWCS